MKHNPEPDPAGRTPITWEMSYEGQLRKLVGHRRLIIPAAARGRLSFLSLVLEWVDTPPPVRTPLRREPETG